MTITPIGIDSPLAASAITLWPVVEDLYRDIHKGIRSELFAVTQTAGELDPSNRAERSALADHLRRVVDLLVSHAQHEDGFVQPLLDDHLPALAARIHADHPVLEARMGVLLDQAHDAAEAASDLRFRVHRLYVELASFTSAYLAHQDVEERDVMPALEAAVGADAVFEVHHALVAAIPPDEVTRTMAVMLPAMNVDDRTDLLGGMRAGAPAEVFDGMWTLAASVLERRDVDALAARLGL